MPNPFASPVVTVRPALAGDKDAVIEFCKTIWEGHDYIKYVWDEWFADHSGMMITAEYAGKAVGIGKLTHPAPGQWWLEGLRVDPVHQDNKISSQLHDYLVEYWQAHCDGVLRLMTSSKRVKVHHLMEKTGFRRVLEDTMFLAPIIEEPASAFTPISANDIPAALEMIRASDYLRHTNGLVDTGWLCVTPNEVSLAKSVTEERALWWRDRQAVLTYWFDDETGQAIIMIESLGCCDADLPALLTDYRRLAAQVNSPMTGGFLPVDETVMALAQQAGFVRDWVDESLYIFELSE